MRHGALPNPPRPERLIMTLPSIPVDSQQDYQHEYAQILVEIQQAAKALFGQEINQQEADFEFRAAARILMGRVTCFNLQHIKEVAIELLGA
ncbi:hypothetical protein [Trichocoleus sp. FACHB-262]|uniref:hypothetical protein n=1 Tax=Trichocoleus sp. FACHB-262 TaxID=2692869 RepID=UPI001685F028|nr:hypothetical protein [Trichocoleus sp. FACHB-262]MBD2122044.1 hypothetical protein [Trichocoleus sp. FACHB-262]